VCFTFRHINADQYDEIVNTEVRCELFGEVEISIDYGNKTFGRIFTNTIYFDGNEDDANCIYDDIRIFKNSIGNRVIFKGDLSEFGFNI